MDVTTSNSSDLVLIDGHVHIYDCFDLGELLDAAYQNFRSEADRRDGGRHFTGILLLAEVAGDHWFQRIKEFGPDRRQAVPRTRHAWTFNSPQHEDCSIVAMRDTGECLTIVAGRQVVTAEKLEVLALATGHMFDDGKPVEDLIRAIRRTGAIAVIPWAVGKWFGRRGAILTRMLQNDLGAGVHLGDNGGRPTLWRSPAHFKQAVAADTKILPGSDPLPLASEISRVGSFGFTFQGTLSHTHPAQDLRRVLADPDLNIHPCGNLERPYRFLKNQIAIRLARRRVGALGFH